LYIVTGASGWMGRTTLEYLKNSLNVNLQVEVRCFSSRNKQFELSDGEVIQTESLDRMSIINSEVEGVFHFAFLTRDYVSKYGLDKYVAINNSILDITADALKKIRYKWVVGVSSGAVFDQGTNALARDINKNPYGFLKLQEESMLQQISMQAGANCVIGRLWASTGRLMPVDRKYAISDFIYQGLTSNLITVQSGHQVWRRYIDAQDFMEVLGKMAANGLNRVLDSSGSLVEIGELAAMVGLLTSSEVSRIDKRSSPESDLYYPKGGEMDSFVQEFGLSLKSLDEQLASTIEGHKAQLAM